MSDHAFPYLSSGGFLLAFPLYWLIRRVLRPAIIDDRTARRRRRPKAIGV